MVRTATVVRREKSDVTGWWWYVLSCGHHYWNRAGDWPDTSWTDEPPLAIGTVVHCTGNHYGSSHELVGALLEAAR